MFGICRADDAAKPSLSPKDKLIVETVLRLKDFDIESSAPAKAAMLRYLESQVGTEQYFELVERFGITEVADQLVELGIGKADETTGVRAAEVLFALDRAAMLQTIIKSDDVDRAVAAVTLVGHAGGKQTSELLLPLLHASDVAPAVRTAAIRAVGRRPDGQQAILEMVSSGHLPEELTFAAANVLFGSSNEALRKEAAKYLALPATADSQPLPPLSDLIQRQGNPEAGKVVFQKTGTCINCHKVHGEGKEVGPDLSEIGSKLSREAMFVSILDPSLAISHNYETYTVLTDSGDAVTGLMVSNTDQSVKLRTAEGIDKTFEQEEIEILKKQPKSLMPQDLQRLMTVDQLVDLVEYTLTLTKQ